MSLIVTGQDANPQTPIEEGSYGARCIWVIDLGTQQSDFGPKRKVLIGWELPEVMRTFGNDRTEPAIVSKFYTACLSDKSNLRRDLELWRGRAFNDQELKAFDLAKLIGAPALLTICHRTTGSGERKASVAGLAKPPKGLEVPSQLMPSRLIDLDELDYSAFAELPQWIKELVQKSAQWQAIRKD